jgi:GR25 family glycosyltransferase involved in LPS biosynthesis
VSPYIAGDGKMLPRYNHVDINTLPIYSNFYFREINKPKVRIKAYNCWLCQRKIFEYFINNYQSHNYLLLIEDDCVVQDNFMKIIKSIGIYFNNHYFDFISLGYRSVDTNKIIAKNLTKITYDPGYHAVIISYKMIEFLLQFPPIAPYDNLTALYCLDKFHCFGVKPPIVKIKGLSSNILQ